MQKYSDVILDRKGNVVPSATVLVKALGSATPATIYAANSTSQLQANPIPVNNLGAFSFYAPNGRYSLEIYIGPALYAVSGDILLEDPQDATPEIIDGGTFRNGALENVTIDGEIPLLPSTLGALPWSRAPLSAAITTINQMLSAQPLNIWEFAGLITTKPTPNDPTTWDWTPAFVAAANSDTVAIAVPGMLYNLGTVPMTKNKVWLCQDSGVTFKRLAGLDISQTTWTPGVGMFEINVHGVDAAFIGAPTFDGNQANQPAIEPNGFALKIHPPTMTSTLDTRVYMDRPKFKNGTSGYLMLRGADFNRTFRTIVKLDKPVFTDTRTGKGKGDPSTPTPLGWSPNYVCVMDFVEFASDETDMSFSRPTVMGEYAPVGILGTYYGQTPANSGECRINLTGLTRLQGLGRKGQYYDGSSFENNGIGAVDVYGNGESLVIGDVYTKDCEAVSVRAKSSIRRFVVGNVYGENCDAVLNVSTSSTGDPQAVVEIGNVVAVNCGIPCINLAGNSASLLMPSVHMGNVYIKDAQDNGNVSASANGAVHTRYIGRVKVGVVEVEGSAFRGVTSVENVDFIAEELFIRNTVQEGVLLNATVNSNVIGSVKVQNAGVAGLSLTGTPKLSRINGGDFDGCQNYGLLANLSAGAGRLNVKNVNTSNISGNSRGLYFANVNARVEGCSAGAGVTTPLLKVASARVEEFGNSWNPATFYGIAAPTDGTYKRGDIVYNTLAAASGTVGWVCVTAGSPGTWKTFGAISA